MKRVPAILFPLLFALAPACAQQQPRRASPRNAPGQFDYYVLSLSWSPEHCAGPAGARDRFQCAGERKYGFIVHGLWPQFEKGWPESCTTDPPPDRATVDQTLPIMPSPGLIRHEWSKHGTCSGLSSRDYFARIRSTFSALKIPPDYQQPLKQLTVKPIDIKRKFVAANPGHTEQSVRVQCSGGRFLSEVRVCLDKDMKPRPCARDVGDCRSQSIIMQPVR